MVDVEEPHRLREDGRLVLDPVRLVDDHVQPAVLHQRALLRDDDLVRREAHVERAAREHPLDQRLPPLLVAVELERGERGAPAAHLVVPVAQRRLGHDDEVGPREASCSLR